MFQLVLNSIQKTINVVAPPMVEEVEFKYHCQTIKEYFSNEQNLEEINTKVVEDTQIPKHMNGIMRLLLEDNERLFLSNQTSPNDHKRADGQREPALSNETDSATRGDREPVSASIEELNPTLSVRQSDGRPAGDQPKIIDPAILNTEITISTFMECLLSENILVIIINAAKYDLPVGITMHCFKFLSRLLRDYKVNLLNHCSVLTQINELISMCATNVAGPYEQSQIEFLSVIINKIQLNYSLINCFSRNDFPLLNSLISMLSSPDNEIADRAGQLLIELVSIVEEDVVKIILSRTLFKKKMVDLLIAHYQQIPSTINPEDIQTVISLQENNQSLNDSLSSLSYQIRKFLIFFKWFSFLDLVLTKCKSSHLASQLLEVFKTNFLVKNLSTKLFLKEELNLQILSTILTFACLKNCKSTMLKESIIDYLLDEKDLIKQISDCPVDCPVDDLAEQLSNQVGVIRQSRPFEHSAQPATDKNEEDKLGEPAGRPALNRRKALIGRCRIRTSENVNHQFLFRLNLNNKTEKDIYNRYLLNLYTLQLLEEILSKSTKSMFEELFVRNLMKRTYLDITRYNINSDLNELEELNKICDVVPQPDVVNEQSTNEQTENAKPPFNIEAIKSIKFFVALIPNELKSCNSDFGYLDFEPYIEEAQKRFDECLLVCEHWGWPKEIVDNYFSAADQQSAEFVESDLLLMLFDNLASIIQTPYELNLQITSLITRVCLFPHPNLHEYLLNPSLPLKENCRSLFSELHRIVERLQIEVKEVKQLKVKLSVVRTFLLGENSDLNGFEISSKDQKILEAIIIVEEFCKELASVGFVKNTYLV